MVTNEYRSEYYRKNRDMLLEYYARYRAAHREKLNAYQKQYYATHREEIRAKEKERRKDPAYRQKHLDAMRRSREKHRADYAQRQAWVRNTRTYLGMTQTQLCKLLDVSQVTVSEWELGLQKLSKDNAIRLRTLFRAVYAQQTGKRLELDLGEEYKA